MIQVNVELDKSLSDLMVPVTQPEKRFLNFVREKAAPELMILNVERSLLAVSCLGPDLSVSAIGNRPAGE